MTEDQDIVDSKRELDNVEDVPAPPLPSEDRNINGLDEPEPTPSFAADDDGKTDTPMDIDEIIETAVGVSMEAFERRHPTTARYLKRRLGDPLEFTIEVLKKDELYQQLVANTEEALDIANIIRVIVSVAMSVAERLLIAL